MDLLQRGQLHNATGRAQLGLGKQFVAHLDSTARFPDCSDPRIRAHRVSFNTPFEALTSPN